MTVAMTQAKRHRRARGGLRVDRQHVGVARRVRRAGGHSALVFVPAGKVAIGKLAQTLAYGARRCTSAAISTTASRLVRGGEREARRLLVNSINPFRHRGAEDDRPGAAAAARVEAARLDRGPGRQPREHRAFGKALREAHALG